LVPAACSENLLSFDRNGKFENVRIYEGFLAYFLTQPHALVIVHVALQSDRFLPRLIERSRVVDLEVHLKTIASINQAPVTT
jgi:hypothetical protein